MKGDAIWKVDSFVSPLEDEDAQRNAATLTGRPHTATATEDSHHKAGVVENRS